mgnify:CR=1 FL=1
MTICTGKHFKFESIPCPGYGGSRIKLIDHILLSTIFKIQNGGLLKIKNSRINRSKLANFKPNHKKFHKIH